MKLADIRFILKYMKTDTKEVSSDINEAVTKRVQFIFETNGTVGEKIKRCLNENNYHISSDEFSLIRDIIFRFYNPILLYGIDRQEYLSRMLSRRDDRKTDYFIVWFQYFLCEVNADWMDYQTLLHQWTECFIQKQELFSNIIKKIDMLIEHWKKAAPNDNKRSTFFVTHMVTQCFRQGRNTR